MKLVEEEDKRSNVLITYHDEDDTTVMEFLVPWEDVEDSIFGVYFKNGIQFAAVENDRTAKKKTEFEKMENAMCLLLEKHHAIFDADQAKKDKKSAPNSSFLPSASRFLSYRVTKD